MPLPQINLKRPTVLGGPNVAEQNQLRQMEQFDEENTQDFQQEEILLDSDESSEYDLSDYDSEYSGKTRGRSRYQFCCSDPFFFTFCLSIFSSFLKKCDGNAKKSQFFISKNIENNTKFFYGSTKTIFENFDQSDYP